MGLRDLSDKCFYSGRGVSIQKHIHEGIGDIAPESRRVLVSSSGLVTSLEVRALKRPIAILRVGSSHGHHIQTTLDRPPIGEEVRNIARTVTDENGHSKRTSFQRKEMKPFIMGHQGRLRPPRSSRLSVQFH
jgi:hypothetical protein